MKKIISFFPFLLVLSTIFYSVLSWILFFRDQRALNFFAQNYPALGSGQDFARQALLNYHLNTIPTLIFLIISASAFIFYFWSTKINVSLKQTFLITLLLQAIVFFSYPVLSTDIYDYINSDRLSVIHHQNVWTTPPEKIRNDKFFQVADYTNQVRVYGPVNQWIYNVATFISGDDVLTNLAIHKGVVIAFVIGSFFLLVKILKNENKKNISQLMLFVFWNPLFIIETAGSGHNDIIMLFFLLGSYLFFIKKKYFLSGILIALSVQVKTTPLFLLPFIGIFFLREKKWADGIKYFLAFVVTYLLTFATMQTTIFAIIERQSLTTGAYWQSLPLIIERHISVLSPLLKIGLLMLLIVQGVRTYLGANPWKIFVQTLLLYLLIFLPTLWNWYCLWLLIFIPILGTAGILSGSIIGFTVGSLFAYGSYWVALRVGHQNPIWQVVMYGTILLPTVLGAKYGSIIKKN